MSNTIGSIKIKIGGDIQSLEKSLKRAEFRLQRSGRKLAELGSRLSTAITLPIIGIGAASIKTAGDLQSLKMGIESMMGSAEAAKNEIALLRKEALKPGLNFEQALKGSVRLQAVGVNAELSRRALAGFGNALALVGGTGEQLDGVTLALTQIAAKGKISAEEINQLAERVPQIRKILKDAFGTADTEELQKLGIGFEEFVTKAIVELEKLPRAQSGIKNSIENTKLALQEAAAIIGERLFPIFEKISTVVLKLASVFSNLPVNIQDNIIQFGLLAAAIGPVLSVMGSLKIMAGSVLGGLAGGLGIIKSSFLALFSPISLIVGAIAGIGVAILGDIGGSRKILVDVINYFIKIYNESTFVKIAIQTIGVAFKALKSIIVNFASIVFSTFKGLGKLIKAVFTGDFGAIKGIISNTWRDIKSEAGQVGDEIGDAIKVGLENALLKEPISLITEGDVDATISKAQKLIKGIKEKVLGGSNEEINTDAILNDLLNLDFNRDPKGSKLSGGSTSDFNDMLFYSGPAQSLGDTNLIATGLDAHIEKVQKLAERYRELRNTLTPMQEVFVGIGNAISDSLAQGAKSFKDFARSALSSIADVIGAQIKLGVTKAITSAIGKAGPFGLALAGIAGGIAAGLFKTAIAKISPPKLATGGLAFGETLATVGDNINANVDPEVIAPLSKLKGMLDSPTVNINIVGEGRIKGQDIVWAYQNYITNQKRFGIG